MIPMFDSKTPVADYFADRAHWTQGAYARDAQGCPRDIFDPHDGSEHVTCMCLDGAIRHYYPKKETQLAVHRDIARELLRAYDAGGISDASFDSPAGVVAERMELLRNRALPDDAIVMLNIAFNDGATWPGVQRICRLARV